MYQPALNAYQHGLDQSLEGAFRLASQPTPAQVFLDSLRQREQVDWQRQMQEEQAQRAWQETQRKAAHEDYLFGKWKGQDENADLDRAQRDRKQEGLEAYREDKSNLGWATLGSMRDYRQAMAKEKELDRQAQVTHWKAQELQARGNAEQAALFRNKGVQLQAKAQELAAGRLKLAQEKFGWAKEKGVSPDAVARLWDRNFDDAKAAGVSDDDAEAFADQMVEKAKIVSAPKPQAAPQSAAVSPGQGKTLDAKLKAQYDGITDPAKKAEAKRRLIANGYKVP